MLFSTWFLNQIINDWDFKPTSFWHTGDQQGHTFNIWKYENKKAIYGKQQKDSCGVFFFLSLCLCKMDQLTPFKIAFTYSTHSKIKQFPVLLMSIWHLKIEVKI